MKYPIVAYGDPVLRKEARDIEKGEIDVKKLADDMFETMYAASGVGLAAPQIGMDIRVFVVDGTPINESAETDEDIDPSLIDFKKVFINAEIIEESGEEWAYEEGCLSIPGVRADVYRPEFVKIRYFDTDWNEHIEDYEGMAARIIQHEYDHIDGILFTDHLSSLKKQMLKKKLTNITKGEVDVDYRMKFPK
ncbi:Peptide deformylase [Emticicia oligotrophica DSM 17448]|uniref:Peptide deformylase n=1 Tax=Emticicia oligotrophica (strain DSM 17448 / CIP 109782 / MTCC 6937 / GPTSA100-15) TaxID=929562 RepID=A0ABM5N1E3_EMTOG|nr:peptide deformylase [Emticicia oligotrophica]AFK03174.1 Peptide deformylase [Emticicia oligotrophica DSM 17448]